MSLPLPLMPKREIVKVARGGVYRTDSAVLKTLKSNVAISSGIRVQTRPSAGRGAGGSAHLYCVLNQEAARALRNRDKHLAARYAKAAGRIEGKPPTKKLAKLIAERGIDVKAASLAKAFAEPEMVQLTRDVTKLIDVEMGKFKSEPITRFTGRVADLTSRGAVIKVEGTGDRMPIPRVLLDQEGLSSKGMAVSARWEMTGDGVMLIVVEPMVDDASDGDETDGSPIDMYGTARGEILSVDDSAFVKQMLGQASAPSRRARPRRKLIPIEG